MTVHLIGAGPGDPELLTVRAARLIASADVIVHDALADHSILDLAPARAERIDVGKRPGRSTPQEMINALLIHQATGDLRALGDTHQHDDRAADAGERFPLDTGCAALGTMTGDDGEGVR